MAPSDPATARSRALGALAVLVLALLISLALFVGRGGCTSAVAFDRPPVGGTEERTDLELEPSSALDPAISRLHDARDPAAEARSRVDGVVIDERTKEPVPYLEVELVSGGRVERLAVGGDGRFASAADYPSGEIRAIVRDDGAEVGSAKIAHDGVGGTHEWRVEVPIGPTIPIASIDDRPARGDDWRVRIVETALTREIIGEIAVIADGLALHAPSARFPDRAWSWRALRPGLPRWVRYPRYEHEPLAGVPPALEVRDDVANRAGHAPLVDTVGVQDALSLDTRAFARARVHIARSAKGPESPMRILLYDMRDTLVDGADVAPVFDEVAVGADGTFEIADLEGGTKRIVGWSQHERIDHVFLLPEGPSEVVEVRARPADPAGRESYVRGALLADEPSLFAVAHPGGERRLRAWIGGGDGEGVFERLSDVSMEGLEIDLVLSRLPQMGRSAGVEFRFVPKRARARDVEIAFGPGGHFAPSVTCDLDSPLRLPVDSEFTWSAWAPDVQPLFGSQADFSAGADGKVRTAELAFEPGYGAQIFLRVGDPAVDEKPAWPWGERGERGDRRSKTQRAAMRAARAVLAAAPVPGVVLEIDRLRVGVSDANGELRVKQAIQPARLTLRGGGWRVNALEKLPGKAPRYVAWLRRNP